MAEWLMSAGLKTVAAPRQIPRFPKKPEHSCQFDSRATWQAWAEIAPFRPVTGTISGTVPLGRRTCPSARRRMVQRARARRAVARGAPGALRSRAREPERRIPNPRVALWATFLSLPRLLHHRSSCSGRTGRPHGRRFRQPCRRSADALRHRRGDAGVAKASVHGGTMLAQTSPVQEPRAYGDERQCCSCPVC